MPTPIRVLAFVCVGVTLGCSAALAAPAPTNTAETGTAPAVKVSMTRGPVDKSYRKIMHGMEVFEQRHSLAPAAALRFMLLPRLADTNMDGIVLKIVGDTISLPVPVAADHTFSLERVQQALDEDASVIPNRKAHSLTWRADIRTPGLPANMRRLGDLRLECEVGMASGLISEGIPILGQLARVVSVMADPCTRMKAHYFFFTDRPLFGVTLVDGERRAALSIDDMYGSMRALPKTKLELSFFDAQALVDRAYFLPLGDKSWSDDTLVEFDYMDDDKS
jgi:hypothetical protein